jgi:hypothetical protein
MTTVPAPGDSLRMTELLFGFSTSQALYAIARLGVAEALLDGPRSIEDLAESVGADIDALGRVIRTLAPLGVFRTELDGRIAITPLGATLTPDAPGSVHAIARFLMETHYQPFGELLDTVRTGEPAAEVMYGMKFEYWMAQDPERVAIKNAAMASVSNGWRDPFLESFELPAGDLVADLGAADGSMLARLMQKAPGRRGIVFDLPEVISAATQTLAEYGVDDRVAVKGGSLFNGVPTADVYLMSMVLHDWNDESAALILKNIAAAAAPGARLVVIEHIIPAGDTPDFSKPTDLIMLGMTGGKERTAAEYADLLMSAGFNVDTIKETGTPFSAIEATVQK